MKNKIRKLLESKGYRLISAKFGVCGDWIVVCENGQEKVFPTLGHIRYWLQNK